MLKEAVAFQEEIMRFYELENRESKEFAVGQEYLTAANTRCQGRWTLVLVSGTDIASVMLPLHRHPIEVIPESGLSVFSAVQRLQQVPKDQMPKCWDNISSHKERDFSQTHICLESENGILKHVDGVHRLLAYVLFGKGQEVPAYVAGL
jgi:hypothetical protein